MELVEQPMLTPRQGSGANSAPAQVRGESADERSGWRVDCQDATNRRKALTVLVDQDSVVLVGPPGQTAVLSARQVGQLQAALREAADRAER